MQKYAKENKNISRFLRCKGTREVKKEKDI